MGISTAVAKFLLKESQRRTFKGRLLTLGKMDIWFPYDSFQKMAEQFNIKLTNPGEVSFSTKPWFLANKYISDICFFKCLGFYESRSIDYSEYESADYVFDLNNNEIPKDLIEAFDVIVDGGTLEHIFNIHSALNNLYKMLRQGGRIIHFSPAANYIDHGFYVFSPTLFWDFYMTNKFEINNFQIFRQPRDPPYVKPSQVSNYTPGCLRRISAGGLDNGMYGICCIVTKNKDSTGDKIPQQGECVAEWKLRDELKEQRQPFRCYPKLSLVRTTVKRIPFLYKPLRVLIKIIRGLVRPRLPRGLGLKVVDRY